MRQGTVLSDAASDGYEPLGAFGQPVHESYVQLRAAVQNRLGARYADFFARPQLDDQAGRIRWVAPITGDVRHWRDLPREEQTARALDLQIMRSQFRAYLDELRADPAAAGDGGGQAFAAVLEQALKTPDDGHLHFVGDQPVASFWGFRGVGAEPFEPLSAAPPPLTAAAEPRPFSSTAAAPSVDDAPQVERGWAWPWWLLLLLLLLLLALALWWWWRTMPESSPLPPSTPPTMEAPVSPAAPMALPQRDAAGQWVLPDGWAARRDGLWVAPDGTTFNPATGDIVPGTEPDGSLLDGGDTEPGSDAGNIDGPPETAGEEPGGAPDGDDSGADGSRSEEPSTPEPPAPEPTGDTPPEPPAGQPTDDTPSEPAGEAPPQPEPGAGEPIRIPDDAAAGAVDGPAGFASGRWVGRTELADDQGGAVEQSYELDGQGQGRSIVRRGDGITCSAPAEARMEGGQLRVRELEDLRCGDGSTYERSQTVCERDGAGRTVCRGVNADGSTYGVQIERAAP